VVWEYAIGADGTLSRVERVRTRLSPTDLLLGPAEQAFVVQSENAYAAASVPANNVSQFAVSGGDLTALSPASVATVTSGPRGMCLDPDQELLLVTSENGASLSLFQRDPLTGLLAGAGSEPVASTWDVTFEPSGRFAYATVRITGVQPFSVDHATPDLTPLTLVAAGVDPRNLFADPTGRFLYVAETTGGVFQFVIDPATGELTAAGSAAGAGATGAVVVHPSGRYAYATNFAGDSISMYALDSVNGTLAPLTPPTLSTGGGANPAGMDFDPHGNHLYVAFSGSHEVAHYTVDKSTGLLTFESSLSTFAQLPQNLAVDATGSLLACTNSGTSGIVSLFALDPATGAPTPAGFAAAGAGPTTGVLFSRDIQ
jgi:6-phosphogluconolactonase (cycloisomerase 2 family)